jgi:hypothetical protein
MRQSWSNNSRFGQQLYFSKDEIDRMCETELHNAGYFPSAPSPINIERFVEKHYARIEFVELPEGVLGYTEFAKNGKIVRDVIAASLDSDKTHIERRLRSTVAHEAGHCMLHPSLFISNGVQTSFGNDGMIFLNNMKFMCRDTDIRPEPERKKRFDGRWWEYQANRAIGGFLLPKKLVEKVVTQFVKTTSLGTAGAFDESRRQEAICLVADTFDVNPKVAEIRLRVRKKITGRFYLD